jgi:hypothetical protein
MEKTMIEVEDLKTYGIFLKGSKKFTKPELVASAKIEN